VLFIVTLLVLVPERPDLNTITVASAIQDELDPNSLVECDNARDDWRCSVLKLSQPTDQCLLPAIYVAAPPENPVNVLSLAPTQCTQTQAPEDLEVSNTGEELVGRAAMAETRANQEVITATLPEESWLSKGWGWLTGKTYR
jgi:hypothetical protein